MSERAPGRLRGGVRGRRFRSRVKSRRFRSRRRVSSLRHGGSGGGGGGGGGGEGDGDGADEGDEARDEGIRERREVGDRDGAMNDGRAEAAERRRRRGGGGAGRFQRDESVDGTTFVSSRGDSFTSIAVLHGM